MPGIVDPTSINNSRQVAGSSTNTCAKNKNINSINLECEKAQDIQFLEVGKQTLVKFKTKGSNWVSSSEKVTVEINPTGIFQLSTTSWDAQPDWILLTNITTNSIGGEATLQFKVDGCPINSIKLTTKVGDDNDVFDQTAIQRLIDENEQSVNNVTPCIIAADKQLGKLLNNTDFFITDISNNGADVNNIYKRASQMKVAGFIESEEIFPAKVFGWQGIKQPEKYNDQYKHAISQHLENKIKNRRGYHVFYFTILNGYHVLTLVVNAQNPCNMTYYIYDQIHKRNECNFDNIDEDFLNLNINNWQYAAALNNPQTASTKFGIWKIKRK